VNAVASVRRTLAGAQPIWGALVAIVIVGWVVVSLDGGTFLTRGNVTDILQRSVALGIVAVGQTAAIVAGSLDLSVAQLISLSSLMAAETMDGKESMVVPGILATLALGAGVGLANGLIVTKLRVNPFIATLGMALLLRGYIEANYAGPAGAVPDSFESFGYTRMGAIPVSMFLFAGVALVVGLALRRTAWGYHVYAVGGDERVSALSGLRTHRVTISAHVLCSVTAALTGLFLASRLGSGSPYVGSDGGYDLESIAAVVLGGTALAGGKGKVAGTVGAVFVLAVLDNIFNQLGVDPFLKQVVRGVVIVAAVAIYARRRHVTKARPPAAGPVVTSDAPAAAPADGTTGDTGGPDEPGAERPRPDGAAPTPAEVTP
jgi:ribose transport system permease protein